MASSALGRSSDHEPTTSSLGRQFHVDLAGRHDRVVLVAHLDAHRLEIEITESLFIDASPKALAHLEALRQMGVRVALDDFGTGSPSLAYLRQFPFDTLKIDRAFVRELVTQRDARAIVKSIMDLARALGMSTVAEGVAPTSSRACSTCCFRSPTVLTSRPISA